MGSRLEKWQSFDFRRLPEFEGVEQSLQALRIRLARALPSHCRRDAAQVLDAVFKVFRLDPVLRRDGGRLGQGECRGKGGCVSPSVERNATDIGRGG